MNRWQDVLELDVEVAIYAGNVGLWDQATWNTDRWGGVATGDGLMWTSIYDRVTSVSIDRGRPDMFDAADTGTANIDIINDDGWANGLQTEAGMAPLVPGRQVRVSARPAGSEAVDPWTPLWIGYVEAVSAPWRTATTSMATLRCVDALARLSRVDPLKTSMPREAINTRLNRLLDMAGWTGGRNLASGGSVIIRASTADQNLLNEVQETAYAAGIHFVYASRTNVMTTKGMDVQNTPFFHVTNNPAMNNTAGTWCPNLPIAFPGASVNNVFNRINLAYVGGPNQVYENTQSQAAYGIRPYTRNDILLDNTSYVDTIGIKLLQHYAWQRPGKVTFDIDLPAGITKGPALNLAAVELQDQIYTDLKLDPVNGPPWTSTGTNRLHLLVGVGHSITESTWTVSLSVDQNIGVEPAHLTQPDLEEEMAWR